MRRKGGLGLTREAGMSGPLARSGAAVAAVLFGTVGSAAWADVPFEHPPLASPQVSSEVPSAGHVGEAAGARSSNRPGRARRPFLLTWVDGREAATGDVGLDRLAAAQLVIDYLNHWSSPRESLDAVPAFYAGRVRFMAAPWGCATSWTKSGASRGA